MSVSVVEYRGKEYPLRDIDLGDEEVTVAQRQLAKDLEDPEYGTIEGYDECRIDDLIFFYLSSEEWEWEDDKVAEYLKTIL